MRVAQLTTGVSAGSRLASLPAALGLAPLVLLLASALLLAAPFASLPLLAARCCLRITARLAPAPLRDGAARRGPGGGGKARTPSTELNKRNTKVCNNNNNKSARRETGH